MSKYILTLAVLILAGCATPAQQVDPSGYVIAPGVAAESARQTKEAYGAQEDFYNSQASATSAASTSFAFAPYATGTQAAVELAVQKMYSDATSTAAASTQTADANLQAFNARSTSEAGIYTQVAGVTQQAMIVIQRNDELAFERARSVNMMKASFGYFVFIVILFVATAWAYTMIKRLQFSPVGVSPEGAPLPLLNFIDGTFTDLDRSANGTVAVNQKYLELLPIITDERQNEVTRLAQLSNMHTRRRALPHALLKSQGLLPEPEMGELEQIENSDFLLPAWEIINGWDGKGGLPYYTSRGLELIDVDRFPHLAVLGATGTGKSRRFLRPLIACALAAGHRVVIVGKSADYLPFVNHPNADLLRVSSITQQGQAERYAGILESLIVEMNRRDDVLSAAHQSTWAHAGHPRTDIVLDEVGNALRLMDSATGRQARIWIEGLVAEGRKVGFNIWMANQRATGMAAILSQTGKAIFQVAADEERAHHSLRGASELREGYFMARFGAPRMAGSFEPSDMELIQFMNSRAVAPLEPEPWIEGIVIPEDALPGVEQAKLTPPAKTTGEFVHGLSEWEVTALSLYQNGTDESDIVQEVFAGDDPKVGAVMVKELIARWKQVNGFVSETVDPDHAKIVPLVKAGKSVSAIVRELWGVNGGGAYPALADRVKAIVKEITSSSSPENSQNMAV
jgi:hypothetical protein